MFDTNLLLIKQWTQSGHNDTSLLVCLLFRLRHHLRKLQTLSLIRRNRYKTIARVSLSEVVYIAAELPCSNLPPFSSVACLVYAPQLILYTDIELCKLFSYILIVCYSLAAAKWRDWKSVCECLLFRFISPFSSDRCWVLTSMLQQLYLSLSTSTVWVKKISSPEVFWHFPNVRLGVFSANFTGLLYVPIYARLQISIQLTATLTKLCYIKRDHPVHIVCSKYPPSAKTTLAFSDIVSKQLGMFSPNFTHLAITPSYLR